MKYIVTIQSGDDIVIIHSDESRIEAVAFILAYRRDHAGDDNLDTIALYSQEGF